MQNREAQNQSRRAVEPQRSASAWLFDGFLLEHYRHAPGPFAPVERHIHPEYQIGLSRNCACRYQYRGSAHAAPIHSLCVLHPGEPHYPYGEPYLDAPSDYLMLLAPPERMAEAAAGVGMPEGTLPYFPGPILDDDILTRLYERAHQACRASAARLEQDTRLLAFLSHLTRYHADTGRDLALPAREPRRVQIVRAYLHDNAAENVSLARLADLIALSPYHFLRVFQRETGMTPHVYQTNLRIARAKSLLANGVPVAKVAVESGFCDQSHFGRRFKRLVGTTPAQYAKSAILF